MVTTLIGATLAAAMTATAAAQHRARPGRPRAAPSARASGERAPVGRGGGETTPEPRAKAADEEARRLFEAGRVAFEAGRYGDALGYFEAAHARSDRPQLLYNVGLALERLGRRRDARSAYEAYLDALPDADNAAEVRTRLSVLGRPEPSDAPSAAETARAEHEATEARRDGTWRLGSGGADGARDDGGGSILTRWWFWAAVGAAVAGAAIVGAIALGSASTGAPAPGAVGSGGVVFALGAP